MIFLSKVVNNPLKHKFGDEGHARVTICRNSRTKEASTNFREIANLYERNQGTVCEFARIKPINAKESGEIFMFWMMLISSGFDLLAFLILGFI